MRRTSPTRSCSTHGPTAPSATSSWSRRGGRRTSTALASCTVIAALLVGCGGDDDAAATTTTLAEVSVVTTTPPVTPAPSTTVDTTPGAVLTAPIDYVIVSGDSPSSIASAYSITLQQLLDENGWTLVDQQVPEFPFAGETIRIPAGATVPVPTVPSSAVEGSTETTEPESGACGNYVIMEGDNPSIVATKLDTTVEKLNAVNAATEGYAGFILGITILVPC